MLTPENNQTEIMHRESDYTPPKSLSHWFIGRPLQTADAPHQTIGKAVGLAVFASDALSSTAYATQEILGVLAAAGTIAYGYVFPVSIAIVVLLAIVTISYEQTIHAYPGGGGAYIVSRDNLGELPAQIAGAALLTDYILTVAVSISAGVAQIVSAFPTLVDYRIEIGVAAVLLVMLINLRGVKESGTAFAIPTYFFIVMMFSMVGLGIFRSLTGTLGILTDPPVLSVVPALSGITAFLLLHAFANGTTALTGVEAISNGIPAFNEPRSHNAGVTLIWMSCILGALFLGISHLTGQIGGVFSEEETLISQIARTVFNGRGPLYLSTLGATTVILIMAANTAFADFPRLGALAASDGFLPRQLTFRGSRLVFSNGIITLALIASLLIILFKASVTLLIPLYAIGVFLSFTLSQTGMARRWWKIGKLKPDEQKMERGSTLRYDGKWKSKMIVNGFGAACTAVVMLVFAITKFREGAWVVLVLTPLLVTIFFTIHHHYTDLAHSLSLDDFSGNPTRQARHRVIMPISGVHQGTMDALRYARLLSDDVTVVHISLDAAETEKVQKKWITWGEGTRLVILDSPYRLFIEPLLEYLKGIIDNRQSNETITVVVPQFIPSKRWHNVLHMQTANVLRSELLNKHGVVVTDVPYHLHKSHDTAPHASAGEHTNKE
ncbi:MAG TPA: APC family permease [Anaerolineales bacterium]|nr:APC family permease [Anaerolineales bacterium]